MTSTARWLLLLYVLGLGLLVFLPFGRPMDLGDRVNLDPFTTIERALQLGPRSSSYRLLIGNIVAFVPFGILLPLAFRRLFIVGGFLIAVALSVVIELGQLAVSTYLGYAYRSTDVDDVILNVVGATLGLIVAGILRLSQAIRETS
ncbi:MAG TPA: VanZ family protein [Candidatus Limnocylindrales bacterium]|nr:VanZ family protein [Candidatus Limnocylindrales bacterium]